MESLKSNALTKTETIVSVYQNDLAQLASVKKLCHRFNTEQNYWRVMAVNTNDISDSIWIAYRHAARILIRCFSVNGSLLFEEEVEHEADSSPESVLKKYMNKAASEEIQSFSGSRNARIFRSNHCQHVAFINKDDYSIEIWNSDETTLFHKIRHESSARTIAVIARTYQNLAALYEKELVMYQITERACKTKYSFEIEQGCYWLAASESYIVVGDENYGYVYLNSNSGECLHKIKIDGKMVKAVFASGDTWAHNGEGRTSFFQDDQYLNEYLFIATPSKIVYYDINNQAIYTIVQETENQIHGFLLSNDRTLIYYTDWEVKRVNIGDKSLTAAYLVQSGLRNALFAHEHLVIAQASVPQIHSFCVKSGDRNYVNTYENQIRSLVSGKDEFYAGGWHRKVEVLDFTGNVKHKILTEQRVSDLYLYDNKLLVAEWARNKSGIMEVFDVTSGKRLFKSHKHAQGRLMGRASLLAANEHYFVFANESCEVSIYDHNYNRISNFYFNTSSYCKGISLFGETLLGITEGGILGRYSLRGEVLEEIALKNPLTAMMSDSEYVFIGEYGTGNIHQYKICTQKGFEYVRVIHVNDSGAIIWTIKDIPSKNVLYSSCEDGAVCFFDRESGAVRGKLVSDIHSGTFIWSAEIDGEEYYYTNEPDVVLLYEEGGEIPITNSMRIANYHFVHNNSKMVLSHILGNSFAGVYAAQLAKIQAGRSVHYLQVSSKKN